MNVNQIKILRDSYTVGATRPDGRKSTAGEYMRFITDCNLEFVTSKDLVMTDDANGIVHCICANEDMNSQADFPIKVISAAYEDIHAVEAIMSQANFEKFLDSGFLNNVEGFSTDKKNFIIKWSRGIKNQAQQPSKPTPYYSNTEPTIIPLGNNVLPRQDGKMVTAAFESVVFVKTESSLLEAIKNGKSVVLDDDITISNTIEIINDCNINLNGNTISSEGNRAFSIKSGNVTVKNGNIIANGNDAFYLNGIIEEDGNAPCLTLDSDVCVTSLTDCCVLIKGPGSTVNVNGAVLKSQGNYAAIQGNGLHGGIIINIDNNAIIVSENDTGIYIPCKADVTIKSGIIRGKTAIYQKSGNLIIKNGIITGFGDKEEYVYNSNGCNNTGDALIVEACNYPDGAPIVYIEGGTFISTYGSSIAYYQQSKEFSIKNTKFVSGGKFNTSVSTYTAPNKSIIKEDNMYMVV